MVGVSFFLAKAYPNLNLLPVLVTVVARNHYYWAESTAMAVDTALTPTQTNNGERWQQQVTMNVRVCRIF
jgi:hypothetical protein